MFLLDGRLFAPDHISGQLFHHFRQITGEIRDLIMGPDIYQILCHSPTVLCFLVQADIRLDFFQRRQEQIIDH